MAPPFPRPQMMGAYTFPTEIIYAAIVIAICLVIYYKTRELYRLSKHEGIRHFRESFLFFALAYLFRLVPTLFRLADLHLPGYRVGFVAGFFLFGYASAMAIISITRSVTWKKTSKGLLKEDITYHLIALLLATIVFITRNITLFFFIQAAIIITAFIMTRRYHQRRKKASATHYTYLLLLLFWMMNIAIISIPRTMTGLRETLYALSLGVFVVILYKVVWRTRRSP